jgi:hypothetical protein
MTERFKKAYDALCEAFFDGTLRKGTCIACACGNIVASAAGVKVTKEAAYSLVFNYVDFFYRKHNLPKWFSDREPGDKFTPKHETERLYEDVVISLTGYNTEEMSMIENAFEKAAKPFDAYDVEGQYAGLVATFEVLCKLDNVEVDYVKRLKQHPALVEA